MPEPNNKLFGRKKQLDLIQQKLNNNSISVINLYGPGGIGKSAISKHLQKTWDLEGFQYAFVDGSHPDLDSTKILYQIIEQIEKKPKEFQKFKNSYTDFLIVQDVLSQGGGIGGLFDAFGQIKDPTGLINVASSLGKSLSEEIRNKISNRYSLERYLRGVEPSLLSGFIDDLLNYIDRNKKPLVLLFDNYESIEFLDNWFNQQFLSALPPGVKMLVFGRNNLFNINYQWNDFKDMVECYPIPELLEVYAKEFLFHHGLRGEKNLNNIYEITGGYPLLLVLVRQLALQSGGWENIKNFDNDSSKDYLAYELLQRILREEKVRKVREFIEKGVIVRWFNPEIISVILNISPSDAREVYDSLRIHSFVENHPYGMKFHDKIREILLHRLEFSSEKEFTRLTNLMRDYFLEKSGVTKR